MECVVYALMCKPETELFFLTLKFISNLIIIPILHIFSNRYLYLVTKCIISICSSGQTRNNIIYFYTISYVFIYYCIFFRYYQPINIVFEFTMTCYIRSWAALYKFNLYVRDACVRHRIFNCIIILFPIRFCSGFNHCIF